MAHEIELLGQSTQKYSFILRHWWTDCDKGKKTFWNNVYHPIQCWLVLCQHKATRVINEEGAVIEKISTVNLSYRQAYGVYSNWWLMWKGLSHCGRFHLWACDPGSIEKQSSPWGSSQEVTPLHGQFISPYFRVSDRLSSALASLSGLW